MHLPDIKWLFDGILGAFIVSLIVLYLTTQLNSPKNKAKYLYKKHFNIAYKCRKFSLDANSIYQKPSHLFSISMPESLDRDIICDYLNKLGFANTEHAAHVVEFRATSKLEKKLRNKFYRYRILNENYRYLKHNWHYICFVPYIMILIYELIR